MRMRTELTKEQLTQSHTSLFVPSPWPILPSPIHPLNHPPTFSQVSECVEREDMNEQAGTDGAHTDTTVSEVSGSRHDDRTPSSKSAPKSRRLLGQSEIGGNSCAYLTENRLCSSLFD